MAIGLRNLKPSAAKAAPAPATPVVEDNPAQDTASTTALSLFPASTGVIAVDAINAALTAGTSGAASAPFPVIAQAGGPTGGHLAPAEFLPQEVQNALGCFHGRNPVNGIFMNYRYGFTAWPTGFGVGPKTAEPPRPIYSCAIAANDVDTVRLVMAAAKNYQFTKSAERAKFDFGTSKVGHIRLCLELLVYSAQFDQPLIIQSAASFASVAASLTCLQSMVDPKSGALGQFPCIITPKSDERKSKSFTFKEHSLAITQVTHQQAAQDWQSYTAWINTAKGDAETVGKIRGWIDGSDHAVTDDIKAALKAGAVL